MSARIDHVAEADRIRKLANDYEIAHSSSETVEEAGLVCAAVANGYAHAQVHATLALVEQQRIANMQAERDNLRARAGGRTDLTATRLGEQASALDLCIREGLGL
jgi:hypothetical protein